MTLTATLSPAGFAPGLGYASEKEGQQARKSEARGKLSTDEIKRQLVGLGYTQIGEFEWEGEKVEVKAINPRGRKVELYLDPTTGQIIREH